MTEKRRQLDSRHEQTVFRRQWRRAKATIGNAPERGHYMWFQYCQAQTGACAEAFCGSVRSGGLAHQSFAFCHRGQSNSSEEEKRPRDVRPIVCGKVLWRIVEQVILRKHLPTVKEYLKPEQVGVDIKDTATQTDIACSQLLPKLLQQPRMGVPQIDLKKPCFAGATKGTAHVPMGHVVT